MDNKPLVLISFSGTEYLDEWELDLAFGQTTPSYLNNYISGVTCQSGFSSIYSTIRNTIIQTLSSMNNPMVVLTGHSLGGALATLAAYDVATLSSQPPLVYTFASPRVFNIVGAQQLEKMVPSIYRVCLYLYLLVESITRSH